MNRDAAIDTWLRRARKTPQGFGPNEACLDAEVMAAWSDGGLSGEALKLVRSHVLHCSRCQVLAAVLAKLEDGAALPEGALDPRLSPVSIRRSSWLGWFVPLAAAAAAVALWIYIPRQAPLEETTAPAGQMAQAAPPAAAAPADADRMAQARAQEDAAVSARPPAAPKLKAEQQGGRDLKRQANEKDRALDANATRADGMRERTQAVTDPKKADVRNVPPPPPPAPMPGAPVGQAAAVAAATPPPPPSGAMTQAADRAAGAGGRGGAATGAERMAESRLEKQLSKEIVSTDDVTRWRLQGGLVQKSTDGGRTWTPVTTGVTAELTAGASPSPTTCWLVGRGGTVLLTTDGQTWRRIRFEVTDLSAVRATDAKTATVTTADGREFSTIDGGNTWIRK